MSDPHQPADRDEGPEHVDRMPTTEQPLNAAPRPRVTPVLAVLGLFAAIALVFAVITLLRYTT